MALALEHAPALARRCAGPVALAVALGVALPALAWAQVSGSTAPAARSPAPDVFAGAELTVSDDGFIRRARKLRVALDGVTPAAQAAAFVARFAHRLGVDGARVERVAARGARTLVHLQPTHAGVPILDGGIVLTIEDGHATALNNEAPFLTRVNPQRLDADAARQLAGEALSARGFAGAAPKVASLGIVTLGAVGTPVFEVDWAGYHLDQHWVVRVDAHRGRVIGVTRRGKH